MVQTSQIQHDKSPHHDAPIHVIGAGVAGSWHALLLAKAGYRVTLHERGDAAMADGTSHWAGGMLAPYCEQDGSEPVITRLGLRSLALWRREVPDTPFHGSLVVAHARDRSDFARFARVTSNYQRVGGEALTEIEPSLDGRFHDALFFPEEGHVEPRHVVPQLHSDIRTAGGEIVYRSEVRASDFDGTVIDCRGIAARDAFPDLRGVKGEEIIVETDEIELARPVRLLHPRWPLYVIPRDNHRFMSGATSIEREDYGVTVRPALELLSAAYTVHPAFGEARILEIGSGLRPALPDNLPRIVIDGRRIAVNGLYRHGFLLAPALAELTLHFITSGTIDNEVMQCA
jgi:glycine oxidase